MEIHELLKEQAKKLRSIDKAICCLNDSITDLVTLTNTANSYITDLVTLTNTANSYLDLAVVKATSNASGLTPHTVVSAANNNATNLKATNGNLYSITAINVAATLHYLKFYNKATAPSPGSDTPVAVFPIPASADGAGLTVSFADIGLHFSTGISYAIVKGIASNDNTSADANAVVVTLAYA